MLHTHLPTHITIITTTALPPAFHLMETKRTILRWCRLFLDRWVKVFFPTSFFFLNKKRTTTSMKEHANNTVSDEAFAKRHEQWSSDTPDTKEAYLIREIFHGRIHVLPIQNPSDLRLFFSLFGSRPFPLENGRSDCSSVNCLNPVPSFYSTHPPFFFRIS